MPSSVPTIRSSIRLIRRWSKLKPTNTVPWSATLRPCHRRIEVRGTGREQ
jgi:hypothetical protein